MRNKVQLITYPDSLGGGLPALLEIVDNSFPAAAAGGIHVLPPFPSSADRGFAPTTYDQIEPRFGAWEDIRRIAERYDVMVDLMVNHLSRSSRQFRDFVAHGRASKYADMFLTLEKVWPGGVPREEDVRKIFLRKPLSPFSDIRIEDTQRIEKVWTSFGTLDWSEQIDLDVHSGVTRSFFSDALALFARNGVRAVRLDAVGYVIKKPGTSCFMVEPEIHAFLSWLDGVARPLGVELLLEVHAHHAVQRALSARGYWVYDFVLPGLILHTLLRASSRKLRAYLEQAPGRQFTMLDCHDGIPVQPDLDGVLTIEESRQLVDTCVRRGANLNRILPQEGTPGLDFDAHQVNCTYYSALERDDDAYLAARALQFFCPGIPQVYYVGLLGGENDLTGVQTTGEGRAINRHNYSREEVKKAASTDVVQRLLRLTALRNEHPAFQGTFSLPNTRDGEAHLLWKNGAASCSLQVDLARRTTLIVATNAAGGEERIRV